jgi:AraC family transcriptional regulator
MNKVYKAHIDRVLQYIEDNLANKVSLAEVAEVSHFSASHFHRIFTGVVGETVNDYIARRRLEKAINLLIFKTELSSLPR